jgi:hypothetical protein
MSLVYLAILRLELVGSQISTTTRGRRSGCADGSLCQFGIEHGPSLGTCFIEILSVVLEEKTPRHL